MTFYFLNAAGAKRSADYFMANMINAMPSHISVVYNMNDEIIWERR